MGRWRPFVGQAPWIEVRPDIKIEKPTIAPVINIELGGLPLSIGLFLGSGLTFLLRTALPEGWPKTVALVAGSGLAVAGIVNLALPKAEAAAPPSAPLPGAPQAPGPAPAPLAPGGAPAPYSPSEAVAFDAVTGRISSPADFTTVDIGPFAKSYPVRVQLHNPSQAPVTFELELTADEDPSPVGSSMVASLPVQVSLGPGQVRDVDVAMPIVTWDTWVDYVDIVLTARKRRAPGESARMLDSRSFVIE